MAATWPATQAGNAWLSSDSSKRCDVSKDVKARNLQGTRQPGISVFTLAIMNIVAVVSLRGLPSEAEYGLSSIFYYLFAAVVFLIPVSLVAAELATGWPEKGGVFRWVGEAFGPRWAFVAMFMLWTEVTVWFPTGLTFGAVSLAFTGPNQHWDQTLSANNMFVLAIILVDLLARHLHRIPRRRGLRHGVQVGRHRRHDHSGRCPHRAWLRLPSGRRSFADQSGLEGRHS